MVDFTELGRLIRYQVIIERSICWQRKDDFLKIIDNFVNGEINADVFKQKYLNLGDEITEKCENYTILIENDLINSETELEISVTSKAFNFSSIVFLNLSSLVNLYSPDITDAKSNHYRYSGNELRRRVKNEILPEIKDLQL